MQAVVTAQEKTAATGDQNSWRAEFERIAQEMREEARAAGIEEMSMEQIDAIIAECRLEMKRESQQGNGANEPFSGL